MKRLVLAASSVLLFFIVACDSRPASQADRRPGPEIEDVELSRVELHEFTQWYETTGTVVAKTSSVVAARMMGTVTSLSASEGMAIKAGQTLLTLDNRDVSQKVKSAEAGLREAEKGLAVIAANRTLAEITLARLNRLHEAKAISGQELDQAKTQASVMQLEYERAQEMVQRARSGLAEATVYLAFTRVAAPYDGVITEKKIALGDMVMPGNPLFTIEDTSSYRLEVRLDEALAPLVLTDQPVEVHLPALDTVFQGVVRETIPAIDPTTRTFLAKIDLTGENLTSGMYAKVRIPVGTRQAMVLPEDVVVRKGQLTGVYVVDSQGAIAYQLVRTGKVMANGLEILSGLAPGEQVITRGMAHAVDGGRLSPTGEEP